MNKWKRTGSLFLQVIDQNAPEKDFLKDGRRRRSDQSLDYEISSSEHHPGTEIVKEIPRGK
jgi:hypothetical protein